MPNYLYEISVKGAKCTAELQVDELFWPAQVDSALAEDFLAIRLFVVELN